MCELTEEKIIIFGASDNGIAACRFLSDNNEILFVCDNNPKKWDTELGGYRVVPPKRIAEHREAIVVLALVKRYNEVLEQLREMQIYNVWQYVEYCNLISQSIESRLRRIPNENNIPLSLPYNKRIVCNQIACRDDKNRVLIFSNYFPPIAGSGVQRPLKFAKYLKNFGYKPIVVTRGWCEKNLSMDYSFLEELQDVEIIRIEDSPIYPEELISEDYEILYSLFTSLGMEGCWLQEYTRILKKDWITIPDADVVWVCSCIKEIVEKVDLNSISLVYTTIGPYSSALFGAYFKLKYGMKWVLDYRDPWCLNDYNMENFYQFRLGRREFEKKLEIGLLKTADHITSSAEYFCDDFKRCYPNIKTTCITNGYDEEDFRNINVSASLRDQFTLLFNGYIYDNYDIDFVLEVINELILEGHMDARKTRLEFNGSNPSNFSSFIEKDKYGIVRYNGYLSHQESLESLFGANILLLFGLFGEGAYAGYSGKLFEYLRTGLPILSISSPYGVQYELIEEHGHGITATPNNKQKMKDFILTYYNEWECGTPLRVMQPDDYVKSFSREYLTARLAQVFDDVFS